MNNLMIDIETPSTHPDAAIFTIGAVFFDIKTGELGETFYRGVRMENQFGYGHFNPQDILFWFKQDKAAQDEIIKITGSKTSGLLPEVLYDFSFFISQSIFVDKISDTNLLKVWGNGAGFDPIILESAYRRCNLNIPWQFRMVRDVRTMVDLGRDLLGIDPKIDMPFAGTPHCALDDAIHQAKYVSAIYQQLQHCVAAMP